VSTYVPDCGSCPMIALSSGDIAPARAAWPEKQQSRMSTRARAPAPWMASWSTGSGIAVHRGWSGSVPVSARCSTPLSLSTPWPVHAVAAVVDEQQILGFPGRRARRPRPPARPRPGRAAARSPRRAPSRAWGGSGSRPAPRGSGRPPGCPAGARMRSGPRRSGRRASCPGVGEPGLLHRRRPLSRPSSPRPPFLGTVLPGARGPRARRRAPGVLPLYPRTIAKLGYRERRNAERG
jgi:hypothetical protein